MTIRVVIADDDSLIRAGLRVVLDTDPDITIVGEAGDGLEAVARSAALAPDVVLMDVRMPGIDGIEATRRLIASHPDIKVLVLTTFQHDEYVWGALRAGASGFLLKRATPERLMDAVRVIAAGDALLDPAVTRSLIRESLARRAPLRSRSAAQAIRDPLTSRENQVLALIGQGLSNREIADLLVIAESTVKTHVKRVMAKIGAHDRAQAVVFAYEAGLMAPSNPS